jgi:hypothetical protein
MQFRFFLFIRSVLSREKLCKNAQERQVNLSSFVARLRLLENADRKMFEQESHQNLTMDCVPYKYVVRSECFL